MRFTALMFSFAAFFAFSVSVRTVEAEPDFRHQFTYAPPPEYPEQARATHLEGAGIFEGKINLETGAITKVVVVQSTGHKLLDNAAIGAIRHWRAKPHTIDSVDVPMNFHLVGRVEDQLRNARAHATYAPVPVYPYSLWRYGIHSGGTLELTIDPKTGGVTDVKVVATSRVLSLDQSCLDTFRRWRFVPNTVKALTISYSF